MRLNFTIIIIFMAMTAFVFLTNFCLKTQEATALPTQNLIDRNDSNLTPNVTLSKFSDKVINKQIEEVVQKLYSNDSYVRLLAKKKIIKRAGKSQIERQEMIDSILSSLKLTDTEHGLVDLNLNYNGWRLALSILVEIKANEALPILITCLDCNNGIGGDSLDPFPVARSVSLMGDASVPYLENALDDPNKNNTFRLCAVLALDSIPGKKSRAALGRIFLREKNLPLKSLIKRSLET